ncbi:MAG: AI-2E family transporter [Isosphaeraceae bacterium]
MPRPTTSGPALVVLAVLGVMAALHLMRVILILVALAVLLACALAPAVSKLRRLLPVSPMGAGVLLFFLLGLGGLYLASLAAGSLVQAGNALPGELSRMSDRLDVGLEQMIQGQPYLKRILPEPGTVTRLTYQGRLDLISRFGDGLIDRMGELGAAVAQGFIVLVLALFLLAESEMLSAKVIRFFARGSGDAAATLRAIRALTREIRVYLLARTAINVGMGLVVTLVLWLLGVRYPVALGIFAALTNYVPYVGQVVGGTLPVLMTLLDAPSLADGLGDALIVASAYLAVVTIAEYVVVPYILGRSLDLNGTTVLLACLFWGFLWGLVGLILAIPLTVSLKLVFQHVPGLRRWADLMSRERSRPRARVPASEPDPAPGGSAPAPAGDFAPNAAEAAPT